MTNEIFLGVDGWGTKTEFLLDVAGNKFESKQTTIHPKQVSKKEYFDITYSFISISGYRQYPNTEEYINEGIRRVVNSDRFSINNDCVNGWTGSLNGNPGINIVLGTGAIGHGVDINCNSMRCSGWGH